MSDLPTPPGNQPPPPGAQPPPPGPQPPGPQPPGPQPPGPQPYSQQQQPFAQQDDDDRPNPWLWRVPLALLLIIGTIGGVYIAMGGGESTETATEDSSAEEQLLRGEVIDGELAFVGSDTTDDDPNFESADEIGIDPFISPKWLITQFQITFPEEPPRGLFGGTLENTCDPERMADYLEANPAKADAWAQTQGISTANLRAFLTSLTPTVLTVDTRVTNHGFSNGAAYPIQTTLEAGTAVLVDNTGTPRARCYCGNPLLPPVEEPADEETAATTTPTTAPTTGPSNPSTTATRPAAVTCAPGQEASSTQTYRVINVAANDPDGGLVMRAAPGTQAAALGVLTHDQTGIVVQDCELAPNGDVWWQVQGDWVRSSFLAPDVTTPTAACGTGTFSGAGTVRFTVLGQFDGLASVDTATVYDESGSTWVVFEYDGGGISSAVDLGPNVNGGARDVVSGHAVRPSAANEMVVVLFDQSIADGTTSNGTYVVVGAADCGAIRVPIQGSTNDILTSPDSQTPAGLVCETGASGVTSMIVYEGGIDANGTFVMTIVDLAYDAAADELTVASTVQNANGSVPASPLCT